MLYKLCAAVRTVRIGAWQSTGIRLCSSHLPRITVPQAMVKKIEEAKQRNFESKLKKRQNASGPVTISCKRKQFNHHRGQYYTDFSPHMLASGGWKHRKSSGDHFTLHAVSGNPSVQQDQEYQSFSDLGISKKIVDALEEIDITQPTNVQAMTIPPFMDGDSVLCSAETGCGKTLAYLLPILHKTLEHQAMFGVFDDWNQPCAIILTPSRELSYQVYKVCSKLCENLPILVDIKLGGSGPKTKSKVDILVTTPGVFSNYLRRNVYRMNRLSQVVFDEVDTLFDDSFSDMMIGIIQKMHIQAEKAEVESGSENIGTQLAFVGATMPRDMDNILEGIVDMDMITKIQTPLLHHLQPHVPQKFVRLLPSECPAYLLTHMKKHAGIPSIVFCNNYLTAGFVSTMLRENNIDNVLLHAQMMQEKRDERFAQFQTGEVDVLVCTDIASRGLDTIRAQHIINYNFPAFESDYIHRAGRVGRVGSIKKGFVLSFVSQKWEVDLLWKLETAARKTMKLEHVNANIKRKLTRIINRKFGQNQVILDT